MKPIDRLVAGLALLIVMGGLAACHDSSEVVGPPETPPGAMTYTGYDANGRPVVQGWIRIDLVTITAEPAAISGAWELRPVGSPAFLGPQIGRGRLEGQFVGDVSNRFVANLNPERIDDFVELDGTLAFGGPQRMSYAGRWTWNTFAGPSNSGTFKALE